MSAPDPSRVIVTSDDPRLSDARPPSAHTHPVAEVDGLQAALDGKAATSHTHSTAQVTGLDSALAGKASTSHTHPVTDLTATGTRSSSTYLRGDGSWATPTNTTYSVPTQAEAEAGTATTARATSAAGLKGAIQRWATGTYSTAISAIGQALNRAVTAADARNAIGAGTSNLAIGTTASTAKAGNWTPGISQVTGLDSALAGKVIASGATTTLWSGSQSAYDALPAATRNAVGFVAVIV